MTDIAKLKARVEELAERDWEVTAIVARFNKLVTEGIPRKTLNPEEILAGKEEILDRVQQRAEEYNLITKNCAQGTALSLMEEFGMGIGASQQTGNPQIFIPLHKGADGFMSDEQFKKFYWPTLKQVIVGLIEGGGIPFPALEGHWGSRLEVIQDIPKGKTMWMVDQTDMTKAKKYSMYR